MGQGSDRSALIQELFDSALELDRADRRAYLTNRCGQNSELFAEVWSLVEFADERTGRGEPPTGAFASQILIHKPGEQLGPYTVLGLLGSGAMADVYLASRVSPSRQVALKVLRPGSDPQTVARFRLEGSALARMNHENIARVYEAGETDQAQPYLALEFVEGETLTTYADRHALSIPARLTLFMALCDALEHIHQNGLIHRDLKPANIVVFESPKGPVPKVVDFGIAKSVDPRIPPAAQTVDGALLGTLEYASPEQLSESHSVDTRSDIYSAGVILYELLVGTRPFLLREHGLEGLLRAVREEEGVAPSAAFVSRADRAESIARQRCTTTGHLTTILRSDLDWIVLQALHKSPAERYPTAGEFRRDIERYLRQQPVRARPPSPSYRFRKVLRRHRSATIGGALVTVAAAIGLIAILWQAAVARSRLRDLEQLATSLVSSLNDIVDVPGAMQAKRRLVLAATETLERISGQHPDPVLQEKLATAYERVGQLRADPYTASLGDTRNGLTDLRKAVQLRTRLYRMQPDTDSATKLIQSQYTLAIVLQSAGSNDPPPDSLLKTGALLGETVVARDTTAFETERVLSMIYDLQAEYAYPLGRWEEAIDLVTRAYVIRQRLVHVPALRTEARRLLGGSLGRLAYASQDCPTARSHALAALDIHAAYYQQHPFSYRALLDLSFAYRNAGYALRQNGENQQALTCYRRSLELRRTMAESDSTDLRSLYLLSDAYDALVDGYLSVGTVDSAVIAANTGLGIRTRIAARNDPPPWIGHAIEFSTRSLARAAWSAGDYLRADTLYRKFSEPRAFGSPLEGMKLWRDQVEWAGALFQAGRVEAADSILVLSGDVLRQIETALHANRADGTAFADLALCYVHLAQTKARTSDWNLDSLRRALAYPNSKTDTRPVCVVVSNELACSLADAGLLREAEEVLQGALQRTTSVSMEATLRWNLMSVRAPQGRTSEIVTTSAADFPSHASTFQVAPYQSDLDPYSRLHLTVFRKWPVWGEMPLPQLRRRLPTLKS